MKGKIVFVNQPVSLEKRYGGQSRLGNLTPPLTLCHLASLTRKQGYPSVIIDAAVLQLTIQETIERVVDERPSYLGLYATTVTLSEAEIVAKEAKKRLPDLRVLIGGVHITGAPVKTMERYEVFDFSVAGEGDRVIIDLLDALESGQPVDELPGVLYRKKGKICQNPPGEIVHHLDTLPMPAFDLLEGFPDIYIPPFFGFCELPIATAVVSRGCPAQCRFCDSGIFGDKNLRQYSPKYIVELMRLLKERFGVKQILFYDDDFVMFKKHTRELCEMIIEADLEMTWSCNTRVIDVNPEILSLMKEAGCWQISFGIESGSQRVLQFMRKGITLGLIRQALTWTQQAGIRTNGYFLFGFPTETPEEMEETVRFALSLDLDIFQCTLYTPFPHLKFADESLDYGELQTSEWDEMSIFNPVFVSDELDAKLLEEIKTRALRKFYFRPSIQISFWKMMLSNPAMLKHYLNTSVDFVQYLLFSISRAKKRGSHNQGPPPNPDEPERLISGEAA